MPTVPKRLDGPSKVVALVDGGGGVGQHVVEGIAMRGNPRLVLHPHKAIHSLPC